MNESSQPAADDRAGKSPRISRLRHPAPWSVACALSLLVALCLGPGAPAWIFWTAMGLSCACAAIATLVRRRD